MYIDYNLYDRVVAKTLEIALKINKDKDYIVIEYKDNIVNRYILHLLFMSTDITNKKVYVKTDLLTYLKLKARLFKKRKIKLCCFKEEYIVPEDLANHICTDLEQSIFIIDEVYQTYYC